MADPKKFRVRPVGWLGSNVHFMRIKQTTRRTTILTLKQGIVIFIKIKI